VSQLAKLQADFQAYIYDDVQGASFKQRIVDDEKVGVTTRLNIYADGYRLRIIEALASDYPQLHGLLGDEAFEALARSYIDQYPSTYRNMRWVGEQMAQHAANTLSEHPIAAEMAAFEWALGLAFDAEDIPALSVQDLAAIPPETWGALEFTLHPSVQLLDLHWNVIAVWQALHAEEAPPEPEQASSSCLVWRNHLDSHYRSLDAQEFQALQQIKDSANFGALCESLFETLGESATQQAAQYLASWLEAGMISQINTDD